MMTDRQGQVATFVKDYGRMLLQSFLSNMPATVKHWALTSEVRIQPPVLEPLQACCPLCC